MVSVKGYSKDTLKFPGVWLRDNCQCEQCFNQSAQGRKIDYSDFSFHVKAKSVKVLCTLITTKYTMFLLLVH